MKNKKATSLRVGSASYSGTNLLFERIKSVILDSTCEGQIQVAGAIEVVNDQQL
jgi:hypothetical protein